MKRLLAALLAVVLVCSMSFPAYAAEENKEQDVTAKYIVTATGECRAEIKNGTATADGVTVTGAPTNAKTLVVILMEGETLTWVDGCVDGEAKAAYDIHFLDAQGNRINVSGVSVSVSVSGTDLVVSSVTPSGTDKNLSASVSGGTISFTADGSHYYVISEKDGKLTWSVGHFSDFIIVYEGEETPDIPGGAQTGDNSMLWLWVVLATISAGMIFFLVFWKRRKRTRQNHKQIEKT